MIRVQELKRQKNKSYFVSFLVDDVVHEPSVVSEDLVVEYRLIKGKEFTKERYRSFLDALSIDEIFQKTLKYVMKYQKTEKETVVYLEKNKQEEKTIQLIVQKLKKLHFLDDATLIDRFLDYQLEQHHSGPDKILFLMNQKGFDDDLIHRTLSQVSLSQYRSNMEVLFKKRIDHYKKYSRRQAQNKMIEFLVTKGYPLNHSQAFVIEHKKDFNDAIDEEKELERALKEAINRYHKIDISEQNLKQKTIARLLSKGFNYQDIIKALERSSL